ncbi:alpha/beta fold hydrolase [Streptomyces sp. DSM 44917]|uniref:Alpha/beta fold hydrolase n=1 Tax=Streptomyces boetiae TaxID=3075541 RepID=A0ABU2L5E7_9ACTN|nr:lipase family protein [Streptomyces sp. DSM 44917]MDT0306750.1 alpha/beta fold hydrolase [Streptomyces sp. DSM 44917]
MTPLRAAVAAALASAVLGCATGVCVPSASAAERAGTPAGVATAVQAAAPAASTTASTTTGRMHSFAFLPAAQRPQGAGLAARVTYSSTTVDGAPAVVSGLIFAPSGTTPAGGWPVISWAHGTTGLGDTCAPSGSPTLAASYGRFSELLRAGYAVVATDYAGLGGPGLHPYLNGEVAARGVIDIARAARAFSPGTFAARWAVSGHSQGGHAAMFTGRLAPEYAPELDFRGTVALAPPSNLTPIISRFDPQVTLVPQLVPLLTYIFAGVRVSAAPEFDMNAYLSPLGQELVTAGETLCNAQQWERTQGVNIGELLSRPLDDSFAAAMGAMFDVPTSGYQDPVFIGQGEDDQTVAQFMTNQLVGDLREAGEELTYTTYPGVAHDVVGPSLQDVLAFLRPLLATP